MAKFLKLNLPVAILVNLFDNPRHYFVRQSSGASQNFPDFIRRDRSWIVFIEYFERWNELLFRDVLFLVHCRHDEFWVIDEAWVVDVDRGEQFFKLVFIKHSIKMFFIPIKNLLSWQLSISILVHSFEDFSESFLFRLWDQLRSDVWISGLF